MWIHTRIPYYLEHQNKKPCIFKAFTKNRVSKTVHLQGFWPKTVYLKCFGNQLKTVYLQGPHSSRPRISRPCCIHLSYFSFWVWFCVEIWRKVEVCKIMVSNFSFLYSLINYFKKLIRKRQLQVFKLILMKWKFL